MHLMSVRLIRGQNVADPAHCTKSKWSAGSEAQQGHQLVDVQPSILGVRKLTAGVQNFFAQIKAGLRVAVQPHGGHFWSSMGQVQRPMDIVSLRIDNQERMANMLNDCEISPTNYMIAFLRQRGWAMPDSTMRIPNVIPEVDPLAAQVR